ncbi:4-hydroxy-3-methylbut-2-enyl diphosphate reductase [Geofilum rhodophaeum]|uniref:4-hydroxy-3-methylbut-2-enyl diphosphate reductase n=1 Tax=Geofilum rhodophaeum TaxID=1965019 RepID=UPI000B526E0F|nr:4-hydroxy-3-methylbut-2-enyl diphosphate reductase [Geofilum rhodophaeum]
MTTAQGPHIEIDQKSGFCFGVSRAVKLAEEHLAQGGGLTSIGAIVHNEEEFKRLKQLGLHSTQLDKLPEDKAQTLLFRAHGEPPSSYQQVKREGRQLIDATCPVVRKLQERVHKAWEEMKAEGGQVLIYGKKGHAEVAGLLGQTNNEALVLQFPEEVKVVDRHKKTVLFSQTTMSRSGLEQIEAALREHLEHPDLLKSHRTICAQVGNRVPHLKKFANKHDLLIFVAGKESSNGKVLFEVCRANNPRTFFISSPEELQKPWFEPLPASIGICGATSTPQWLMEQVAAATAALFTRFP